MSVIRFQTSEVFLSGNASRFTDQHTNESAREMERQTDGEGACGEFTLKDRNKNSTDSGDTVTERERETAIQRQTLRQTASQRKCVCVWVCGCVCVGGWVDGLVVEKDVGGL